MKNSMKDLIITQNNDNAHVKHVNPLKTHPERITKVDKKIVNGLV